MWLYQSRSHAGGWGGTALSILNKGTIIEILQRLAQLKRSTGDGKETQRFLQQQKAISARHQLTWKPGKCWRGQGLLQCRTEPGESGSAPKGNLARPADSLSLWSHQRKNFKN